MMIKRAHRRREIVVRVALVIHVLGEIFRLHQFADVVKIGAHATERGVGPNRFRSCFRKIRDDKTVVICARRFNRHPAQERMVQVRRLKPRDVGRNLKKVLEDWQRAADDHGRDNSVTESKRALHAEHRPIVSHGRKPIDRADESKCERKQPDREPDPNTSANEFTAPTHLHGEVNGGEATNQSANK